MVYSESPRSQPGMMTRREMLRLGLGLGVGYVAGRIIKENQEGYNLEARKKLEKAGVGDYANFYDIDRILVESLGVDPLFPEIFQVLDGIAKPKSGIDSRFTIQKPATELTEGWQTAHAGEQLVREAKAVIADLDLQLEVNQDPNQYRKVLERIAEILPGLLITAPHELIVVESGRSYTNGTITHIQSFQDEENITELEAFYHAILHENTHMYDPVFLGMAMVRRIKSFATRAEFTGYLETYASAVFETLVTWSRLNIDEAQMVKGGRPLLNINYLDNRRPEIRSQAINLCRILNIDIPEGDELYQYNQVAHYLFSCLFCPEVQPRVDIDEIIKRKEVQDFANGVIKEIAHFMVGPIYGCGRNCFTDRNCFNFLYNQAALLEGVRLRILSKDGRTPRVNEIYKALFPDAQVDISEEPGSEGEYLTQVGAKLLGEQIFERPDRETLKIGAYELPSTLDMPNYHLVLLDIKGVDELGKSRPSTNEAIDGLVCFLPKEKGIVAGSTGGSLGIPNFEVSLGDGAYQSTASIIYRDNKVPFLEVHGLIKYQPCDIIYRAGPVEIITEPQQAGSKPEHHFRNGPYQMIMTNPLNPSTSELILVPLVDEVRPTKTLNCGSLNIIASEAKEPYTVITRQLPDHHLKIGSLNFQEGSIVLTGEEANNFEHNTSDHAFIDIFEVQLRSNSPTSLLKKQDGSNITPEDILEVALRCYPVQNVKEEYYGSPKPSTRIAGEVNYFLTILFEDGEEQKEINIPVDCLGWKKIRTEEIKG